MKKKGKSSRGKASVPEVQSGDGDLIADLKALSVGPKNGHLEPNAVNGNSHAYSASSASCSPPTTSHTRHLANGDGESSSHPGETFPPPSPLSTSSHPNASSTSELKNSASANPKTSPPPSKSSPSSSSSTTVDVNPSDRGDGANNTVESSKNVVEADGDKSSVELAEIIYQVYDSEVQMPDIMRLIQKDLSEPYSIYTYRYFIHNWPHLCYMARVEGECVGAIVCKLDYHKKIVKRGYIAMLAVDSKYRKRKIGSTLVRMAIDVMIEQDADEIVLETEITNKPALRLYENLGFVRDKRLFRYYLNGVDALRLKLWLR